MKCNKLLNELIKEIIHLMNDAGFADGTVKIYKGVFSRLEKLAKKRGDVYFNLKLGKEFVDDSNYANSERYCHSRYCYHCRCIQFIESFINNGVVDLSVNRKQKIIDLRSQEFQELEFEFDNLMINKRLKPNTIDGYHRIVHYFFKHLEKNGYSTMEQLKKGEIISFIVSVCKEHYSTTSLGAHLPGLKMFLNMSDNTSQFLIELPENLPKKRDIIEVYSDEEYELIIQYLEKENISSRNKAICLLSLEAGLRSVDILNLQINDIDWVHDCICIVQEKTGRRLIIPLKPSYGNALANYLVDERPASDSKYVFLQKNAPHSPVSAHSACRGVILNTIQKAGVNGNGRPYGTRIARHSIASRMLRHGVPLSVISEALGHGNPDSVLIYLSTESSKLVECTLPLPEKVGEADEK